MADDDFKLQLELDLNLKKISMITVAQILWKLPDVTDQIDNVLGGPAFMPMYGELMFPKRYDLWEKIVGIVCKKSSLLPLPCKVKKDLETTVILIGEKIHYFYCWKFDECKWCRSVSGGCHFYSVSSHGILKLQCSSLHWKYTPDNDKDLTEFLDDACSRCDEKIVQKYQDRIIDQCKSAWPGLSFEKTKDVMFNIMCVWNYIFYPHEETFDQTNPDPPEKYMNNEDYIIPLKKVHEMCYKKTHAPNALSKVFANKFPLSGFDLTDNARHYLHFYIAYLHEANYANLYRFENLSAQKFLFLLQQFSLSQMTDFLKKYVGFVLMVLLPVWPYLELVPRILDFCFKKKINFNLKNTMELVIYLIGFENLQLYSAKKTAYIDIFGRLWQEAPELTNWDLLLTRIDYFVDLRLKPIINLFLKVEDYRKDYETIRDVIKNKCISLSIEEKMEVILKIEEAITVRNRDWYFIEFFKGSDILDDPSIVISGFLVQIHMSGCYVRHICVCFKT